MKDKTRYNIDRINKEGAMINIIHGKRSGGKSYQAKHKRAVNKYFDGEHPRYYSSYKDKDKVFEEILEKGTRFILLRRFKDEISTSNIEEYFNSYITINLEELNKYKNIEDKIHDLLTL